MLSIEKRLQILLKSAPDCTQCDHLSYLLVEKSVPLEQYEHAEQLLRRAKDVIGAVAETGNPDWELLQEINSLLEDGE